MGVNRLYSVIPLHNFSSASFSRHPTYRIYYPLVLTKYPDHPSSEIKHVLGGGWVGGVQETYLYMSCGHRAAKFRGGLI